VIRGLGDAGGRAIQDLTPRRRQRVIKGAEGRRKGRSEREISTPRRARGDLGGHGKLKVEKDGKWPLLMPPKSPKRTKRKL